VLAKQRFKEYWSKVSNDNQTMLIGLLLAFGNNVHETLRDELEQTGRIMHGLLTLFRMLIR